MKFLTFKCPRPGFLSLFLKDEKAATAIEYSLVAAGIALAILAIVFLLGDQVEQAYTSVRDEIALYI